MTRSSAERVAANANSFTRYNSIRIPLKKEGTQLYVQANVFGEGGAAECYMMLDTGASATLISSKLAMTTQRRAGELRQSSRVVSYETAVGLFQLMTFERKVEVAGISRMLKVAVGKDTKQNLLGMDFFEGMDYLIDSKNSCIYVWQK